MCTAEARTSVRGDFLSTFVDTQCRKGQCGFRQFGRSGRADEEMVLKRETS